MYDTYNMQEHIRTELEKKAKSGIKSTTDLDTAWKLIDAYKNLLKIDMLQEAGEYSQGGGYSERRGYSRDDGYSERRRRDSMGRYSRNDAYSMNGEHYDRYLDAKHSYRSGKSSDSKQHMMDTLEDCMDSITKQVEEMRRDADTPEEREKIDQYLRRLRSL